VETILTYDARQRLATRAVAGAITSYAYDDAGQLERITEPGGAYLQYGYDNAHRLIDVSDSAGNRIHYTLNAVGQRTKEEVFDASNTLVRRQAQVFNTLGRLYQVLNAADQVATEYTYDSQGNRTGQTEAGAFNTGSLPDALNRIKQVTDAASGVTQYGFNARDQLISVTDPKGLVTSYTMNALGHLKRQISPDTGTTDFTYDQAGNRRSQLDARGVSVAYSYDALNRVTLADYLGSADDVAYTYDGANYSGSVPYGKTRLTGVVDPSGSTTLYYDARGNLISQSKVIAGSTYSTSYSYDSSNRLTGITYPSGRTVTYGLDAVGRVASVSTMHNGVTTIVASSVAHSPFGDASGYTLGNGIVVDRAYDLDGRLANLQDQGPGVVQHLVPAYDLRGNITGLADLADSTRSQTFAYDALSRLTGATGKYGAQSFTYDSVGNRTGQTATPPGGSPAADTYNYPGTSHQLTSISGANATSFSYDAAGNATSKGATAITYNGAQRVATLTQGATQVVNTYDFSGVRAAKQTTQAALTTSNWIATYDQTGRMLAERDQVSGALREYIYLGALPVALINSSLPPPAQPAVLFFHVDHLGTPQKLTDMSAAVVWEGTYEPFGKATVGLSLVEQPLRFPGQYFDAETGLHQNWHRDYDPSIGRYLQSDPIGLDGGLSTYAYVASNPLKSVDPTGLCMSAPHCGENLPDLPGGNGPDDVSSVNSSEPRGWRGWRCFLRFKQVGCGCNPSVSGYSQGAYGTKTNAYWSAQNDAYALLESGCSLGQVITVYSKCVFSSR
jgi:RHS repeat-associated protein